MALQKDIHKKHKTHRNVLYSLVIVLAILQIISFTVISLQVSKLNTQIVTQLDLQNKELKKYTTNLVETYDSLYQQNFQDISELLEEQQADFDEQLDSIKSEQGDFSEIIERSIKAVVTVSTDNSLGSGFFVNDAGYIVTNYHVIDDNVEAVRILTYDRRIYEAELIGYNEFKDLALLKVDSSIYEEIKLADSNEIQVGKKVIAIGNPLGLSFTVTEGIVSGLHRTGPNGLAEYVQTDVSLNPGNSGGPLINKDGEVIGINNFKIGGAEGLSFSLESNAIRDGINAIANMTIIQ